MGAGMYVAQTAGVGWWPEVASETQAQYGSRQGHGVDDGGHGYVATVQPPPPSY
ncbi:hypothetical protein KSP40_PGU003467 [Platanthera guangdongensis]|uniref:Uncharacterized protein n=1 Tax=Platanthera guangdongensis TaxID=2320717 RepID=A0ABR2MIU9_9ASPA